MQTDQGVQIQSLKGMCSLVDIAGEVNKDPGVNQQGSSSINS